MRCPPRAMNAVNNAIMNANDARGACHATKAYVLEKQPLTNRIGRHFARIKAVPHGIAPNHGYRGRSPFESLLAHQKGLKGGCYRREQGSRVQETSGP